MLIHRALPLHLILHRVQFSAMLAGIWTTDRKQVDQYSGGITASRQFEPSNAPLNRSILDTPSPFIKGKRSLLTIAMRSSALFVDGFTGSWTKWFPNTKEVWPDNSVNKIFYFSETLFYEKWDEQYFDEMSNLTIVKENGVLMDIKKAESTELNLLIPRGLT